MASFKRAAQDLEQALKDQEQIEKRILTLRKLLASLYELCEQQGANLTGLDSNWARLESIVQGGLTNDIRNIVKAATIPLHATEIRDELEKLGGFDEQQNPLAMIHVTLNRLTEAGTLKEVVKNGKKAWRRKDWPFARLGPVLGAHAAAGTTILGGGYKKDEK